MSNLGVDPVVTSRKSAVTRSGREARLALAVAVATVVLTQLPRVLLYFLAPPGHIFLGAAWGAHDQPTYFELLGDAAAGWWVFPTRPEAGLAGAHLLYTPYIVIGHLFAPTGWAPDAVMETSRWLCLPIPLLAAWAYVRAALPAGQRALGYFLGVLAGGLGWMILSRPDTPLGIIQPLDLAAPSFTLANSLQMAPHVGLAVAGLAGWAWGLLKAAEGLKRGLWGAVALGAVASFHPFVVPMALLAGGIFVLWQARTRLAWTCLFLGGVAAAPFLLYDLWLLTGDPTVAGWQAHEYAELENLPSILVSRALLLPFAVLGGVQAVRGGGRGLALALCWAGTALLFDLNPLFSSSALHRTVEGSSLALGVLAAAGMAGIGPRARAWVVAACLITPILQVASIITVSPADRDLFIASDDRQAIGWLASQGAHGRLLAYPVTDRWAVSFSQVAPDLPADWLSDGGTAVKAAAADPSTVAARRDQYLLWGEREREVAGPPPAGLTIVGRFGRTVVLRP